MDLTQGPIIKNLLIFSLPILAGTIMTELYTVVDSIVVGKVHGAEALAAVSASQPVISIANLFMIGLSTGSNVVIAQRAGSKKHEALQNAMDTTGLLTLVLGAILTFIGVFLAGPLLRMMDTPTEIFAASRVYATIIFLGTIGNLIYQIGSGALRGMGDSTYPFIYLCICSVVHVLLDILVVKVLKLGVWSVAASTAVSQLLSAILIIRRINSGNYGVKLSWKALRFQKEEAKDIVSIGLPTALQQVANSVAGVAVQGWTNAFGTSVISANSVITKLERFAVMPVDSVSTGITTFVAQNIAVFKRKRINRCVVLSLVILIAVGCLACGGLILGRFVLPKIFVNEPEVIALAAEGMLILAYMCIFNSIDRVMVMAMRGAGKSVVPMVCAQLGAFSRIPLAYFLVHKTGNYMGIFYSMLIANGIRTGSIALYSLFGGWKWALNSYEKKHAAEKEAMIEAGTLEDE